MKPAVCVKKISKTFRVHEKEPGFLGSIRSLFNRKWIEKHALKDVSLDIHSGEIVGLVGANGAGKTTLVKILSGIVHPTSGDADVLGNRPWERSNAFRRQIALVMGQKAQLWWDLPAADCFLLLREIYKIPHLDFKKRLDYLTDALEVRDQLKIQIRRLSLGERMKMELIATLLHQPKVVFLDEPTIGLDLTSQRTIREFLLEYRREFKPAMILTSHYMEDIESLCKRIIIIRKGSLIYDGPLQSILSDYAKNKFLVAKLGQDETRPKSKTQPYQIESSLGEIISQDEFSIRIKTTQNQVASAATHLLKHLPVKDLSIEEEDIGNIVESIMRSGLNS